MINADTVTVEQIRQLRKELERDLLHASFAELDPDTLTDSLRGQVEISRARCAEIINIRHAATTTR